MRFSTEGYPLVVLSHRKDRYLDGAMRSIRNKAIGISEVVVVDDSGDAEHHQWLDDNGYQYVLSDSRGANVGYLSAMKVVWDVARSFGTSHVVLWEEDFLLTRQVNFYDLAALMRHERESDLAQLNLQRQAVYRIERRRGYLESHAYRGYGLTRCQTDGMDWVRRQRPFTTNPGMLCREVLDVQWPSRAECDATDGGAEPAMSARMEAEGWTFGWFGKWNQRATLHVGSQMKTGHGY